MKNTPSLNTALRAVSAYAKAENKVADTQSAVLLAVHALIETDKPDRNASIAAKAALRKEYMAHRPNCSDESAGRIIRDIWSAAEKGITDASKTPRQVAKVEAQKKASIAKSNAKTPSKKGGANGAQTSAPETASQGHDADDWNKQTHRIECARGAREQVAALSLLLVPGNTVTNEMRQLVKSLEQRLQIIVEGF